jgi:hypothetical protein
MLLFSLIRLFYLFWEIKVGLCDLHAVCVCEFPLLTYEYQNQSS